MRTAPIPPGRPPRALAPSVAASLAAAFALTLAGCSRDLALPGLPSGPSLAGFAPAAGYAGQLLRVTGTHFEADAAANTVHFAHASARGERFDGGDLLVRVPADAGDGPITVSNRDGTSAASAEAFDYLGLGELRRGQIIGREPILHHPLRVHAVAGQLLVESALLRLDGTQRHGLVQYGAPNAFPEFVSASAAAPWRNELLTSIDDGAGTTVTVWPMDGAGPARIHRIPGVQPWRILPARLSSDPAQDLLVTFQLEDGLETLRTFSLDESAHGGHDHSGGIPQPLPAVLGATPLGLVAVVGPSDVGDGRVVLVARDPGTGAGRLAVVSLTTGAVQKTIDPPSPHVLSYDAGDRYYDRLAAGPGAAGGHLAAAALDDGWVMLVDLDDLASPPGSFIDLVSTYSTSRVGGLALAATGGTGPRTLVLATKPDDDLVLGIEASWASVAWGLPTRGARRVAAVGTVAWVANDDDNEVQVVNPDLGRQVGRLTFDVSPGTFGMDGYPDPAGGLAFAPADPSDPWSADALYLMALAPTAILRWPLGASEPACALARDEVLMQVAWDATERVAWGTARALYADPLRALAFTDAYTGRSPAAIPIPGATWAHRIVFPGGHAVVAHDGGLSALAGDVVAGSVDVTADDSSPAWGAVGAAPGRLVWLTGTWDGADHAQLWSPGAIAAGGAPTAEWTAGPTDPWILWGVWLEDGLWVDTWDGASPPAMVRLDRDGAALVPAVSVTPAASASFLTIPPAALSPNGRKLVTWEFRGLDTALRIFSADPATGFAERGYVPLEGTITGAAFDATGERLYVLTQRPDRIVTLD